MVGVANLCSDAGGGAISFASQVRRHSVRGISCTDVLFAVNALYFNESLWVLHPHWHKMIPIMGDSCLSRFLLLTQKPVIGCILLLITLNSPPRIRC